MNGRYTKTEREHVDKIKSLACGVCGQAGPSEAHHITQHLHYLVIPLCRSCHDQVPNGPMWKVMKQSEMSVLNETLRKLWNSM